MATRFGSGSKAQVTAAQTVDPIAFEMRMHEARARRAATLAHHKATASTPPALAEDTSSGPLARSKADECSPLPDDTDASLPSLVAPPRRFAPSSDTNTLRVRYTALLLFPICGALTVATSPEVRQRTADEIAAFVLTERSSEGGGGQSPRVHRPQAARSAEAQALNRTIPNRSPTTPARIPPSFALNVPAVTANMPTASDPAGISVHPTVREASSVMITSPLLWTTLKTNVQNAGASVKTPGALARLEIPDMQAERGTSPRAEPQADFGTSDNAPGKSGASPGSPRAEGNTVAARGAPGNASSGAANASGQAEKADASGRSR